ncbi:thioredoxin family protein [Bacillus sp. 1NLA3E]|uniref:thioredoxin family protein n=1 Tax=Bacillus sp. 1NLA3E TaxID=666686 RepID=UPI0005A2924F|nr:thioredoxin family protein [Bacillus sp. 1NLA3E]
MKKVIIFLIGVIVIFAGASFYTNMKNKEKSADNTSTKEQLSAITGDQTNETSNNPNLILPEDLQKKIANKENATVYFYSPECTHCQKTAPIVVPLAKEMGIQLLQYNVLEYEQGWDDYNIEGTPTIVQFKNGKETARIVGYNEKEAFKAWFNENTIK